MKGDLNFDGKINLADVNYVLNCIARNKNYNYLLQDVDINNDKKFKLSDVNYLLKHIANVPEYENIDLFTKYFIEIPVSFHIIRSKNNKWNSKIHKYYTSNGIIEYNDDECLEKSINILNENFSKTIDSTYFKEYKDNYSEGQEINFIKFNLNTTNNTNNTNNYYSITYVNDDNVWLKGENIFEGTNTFFELNNTYFKNNCINVVVVNLGVNGGSFAYYPGYYLSKNILLNEYHLPGYWDIDPNTNKPKIYISTTIPRYIIDWSKGNILSHEIGHNLGLLHTFSDDNPDIQSDGDNIIDTPPARRIYGTYTIFPKVNNIGFEPLNNIMSYTNNSANEDIDMNQDFTYYQMITND